MEKNETTVVKQPQDNANHRNLNEWTRPEMVELNITHTAGGAPDTNPDGDGGWTSS